MNLGDEELVFGNNKKRKKPEALLTVNETVVGRVICSDDLVIGKGIEERNTYGKVKEMKKSDKGSVDNGVVNMRCRRRKKTVKYGVDSSSDEEVAIGELDSTESTIGEEVDGIFRSTEEDDEEVEIEDFDTEGSSKPKKMVHFNGDGQPVGEGSISFVSYLGSMTRKHCPISYEHWKDVPDQIKDMIWKLVTDDYTVSSTYKTQILQRINKHWREFKSKLRSKHYDKYDTDLERIRNCPGGVRHKDWVIFVDNQSTANAQARRGKGKSAREALKTPHTYGRRGAARTSNAMAERSGSLSHQQQSASPKVSRHSAVRSEDIGSFKQKKVVYFNDDGQPVGEGSVSFTSNLGSLTRRHCPISYERWRDVPDQIKDMIWKRVTDRYIVTARFKEQILKKVSKHWREFKCHLRSKYFDRYNIDEERKRNCPRGVRSKDWSIFVENQSTPDARARRRRGKSAREAMKTPHKSGRRGAARTAEELRKRDKINGPSSQRSL